MTMTAVAENGSTRAVRVMHVLFSLRLGGTEAAVVKLVNGLDRTRVVSAIVGCKRGDGLKERLAGDVQVFEFDRRDGNDPMIVAKLMSLFRRERPDIVHTHSWGTLCEGLIAARLAGIRHIVHGEHGTMDTRRRNVVIQRWAWRRVDAVLSVSSRLADRMADQIGFARQRIHVIRNGIDTARFRPDLRADARASLGLAEGECVIGTVGRLVPVKDQAGLIEALARLKQRGMRFRALIAGDGALRAELEALAAGRGVSECLSFLGARSDVERVLAALDIFVLSSVSEGLSNTILEAMASGVPVVATRVGGAEESVEEGRTGILVPASDPDELAAALAALAADQERRAQFGAAGRLKAEREFSLDAMTAAYTDFYTALVTGRHRGDERLAEQPCAG